MIRPIITLPEKCVIVDIDTQRHFFQDRGAVCVRNHRGVLANIRRVVAWARLKNIPMVSTVQIYAGSNSQEKIRYTLRSRHTSLAATDRTDLPLGLLERYEQVILQKRCFDPFKEPRIDRMLSELEAEEFILIGAMTEGAVKATALGLLARRKNVTVLIDATGLYNRTAAKVALRHIWAKGAKLVDTRTLLGPSALRTATAQ